MDCRPEVLNRRQSIPHHPNWHVSFTRSPAEIRSVRFAGILKISASTTSPRDNALRPADFATRVVIATSISLGLVLLTIFLWYATDVILLIVAGVLLAILLSAAIELTERLTGWSRSYSLGLVLAVIVAAVATFFAFAVPVLNEQATELSQKVPESWQQIQEQIKQYNVTRWLANEAPDAESIRQEKMEMFRRAGGMLTSLTTVMFSFFIVLFVSVYLASDPGLYCRGVLRLVPLANRERASVVLAAVGYTLRWWLIGQLIVMSAVGLMTIIGLWALGVPLAILFGLFAFLLDFVPNFGPIIAAVPPMMLSFVESPQKAMYVAMLYFGIQQIEGMVISPLVLQRTVSLPPVLTIAAQVFMGVVAGPLGVLLAAPLTAVVLVLVKMLYVEEVLDDDIQTPEEEVKPDDVPEVP